MARTDASHPPPPVTLHAWIKGIRPAPLNPPLAKRPGVLMRPSLTTPALTLTAKGNAPAPFAPTGLEEGVTKALSVCRTLDRDGFIAAAARASGPVQTVFTQLVAGDGHALLTTIQQNDSEAANAFLAVHPSASGMEALKALAVLPEASGVCARAIVKRRGLIRRLSALLEALEA